MSGSGDPDVTRLLRDLTRELQTLQREIDRESARELSTRQTLSRFTSEVAIPSLILLLEMNIRALKLLRRTIRLAEGREPSRSASTGAASEVRDRAEQLGQATLSRLDQTLAEVQSSIEEEDANEDVQELLAEARQLQSQIRSELSGAETTEDGGATGIDIESDSNDPINIDVDSELRSLKDDLDDGAEGDDDDGDGDEG